MGGPIYGGKFDMALYSFVNGDDPDTTDQFGCANMPPNGYNKSRICDSRIDALLAAGRRTYDATARKTIYARLQALLYAQLPMVFLYQRRELDVFPGFAARAGRFSQQRFFGTSDGGASRARAERLGQPRHRRLATAPAPLDRFQHYARLNAAHPRDVVKRLEKELRVFGQVGCDDLRAKPPTPPSECNRPQLAAVF